MYNTSLIRCFWKCSGNCLFNATKTVSADNQDILYTTILQLIQDGQPVFWSFIITDSDWKNLFFPFCVDAKNDVGSQSSIWGMILSVTSEIKPSDVSLQSVAQMLIYDPAEHRYPCCHSCCLHVLIYIHCGNHRYQIVQISGSQDDHPFLLPSSLWWCRQADP